MDTTRASLLLRIKNPLDASAWNEFDSIYRPMLMRFALACKLHHADAEDVAQMCLAAVQKHMAEFEYDPRRGRFKSWLCTLVRNRVRNKLRDEREKPPDNSGVFKISQQREPLPEEAFEKIWIEELLRHALRRLREDVGEEKFQAFHQYAIEQRPVEEVGRATGLTAARLHKLKWRLTQKLRQQMANITGETPVAEDESSATE